MPLPLFPERTDIHFEGPGRPVLTGEEQSRIRNSAWLDEEFVALVRCEMGPCRLCIYDTVDDEIGDVNALRPYYEDLFAKYLPDTLRF